MRFLLGQIRIGILTAIRDSGNDSLCAAINELSFDMAFNDWDDCTKGVWIEIYVMYFNGRGRGIMNGWSKYVNG